MCFVQSLHSQRRPLIYLRTHYTSNAIMLYTSPPPSSRSPCPSLRISHAFGRYFGSNNPACKHLISVLVSSILQDLIRHPIQTLDLRKSHRIENQTYHAQQSPRRITRLRPNTKPVFRPCGIEFDIFPAFPLPVYWCFGDRVVCACFYQLASSPFISISPWCILWA